MVSLNTFIVFELFAEMAVRSIVVLGAALLAALLMRPLSATTRHMVWSTASGILLLLPVVSILLPPTALTKAVALPFQMVDAAVTLTNVGAEIVAQTNAEAEMDHAYQFSNELLVTNTSHGNVFSAGWRRMDFRLLLLLGWASGVLLVSIRVARAVLAIRRLRRGASELAIGPLLTELCEVSRVRRPVKILVSKTCTMPMSWGILRHEIFMPEEACHWTNDRLRLVFLHELFHIRRADVATQLLANAACALYWFNPLVWLAWSEFVDTRERATDDLVLSTGIRATDYAEDLLWIASTMRPVGAAEALSVGIARPSRLEARVRAILDPKVNRRATGTMAVAGVALLIPVALAVPMSAIVLTSTITPVSQLFSQPYFIRDEEAHDSPWALEVQGTERQYLSPLPNEGTSMEFPLYAAPNQGFYARVSVKNDAYKLKVYRRNSAQAGNLPSWETIAERTLHPGETATLTEMNNYGVKPFQVSLSPDREPNPKNFRIDNQTSSVTLDVEETRSQYVLKFRNTSAKNIAGIEVEFRPYRNQTNGLMFVGGSPLTPIAPGEVRTERESKPLLHLDGSPIVNDDPHVVLWGVAFSDRSNEGDPNHGFFRYQEWYESRKLRDKTILNAMDARMRKGHASVDKLDDIAASMANAGDSLSLSYIGSDLVEPLHTCTMFDRSPGRIESCLAEIRLLYER
jgi:beta-lactamase regulating signal transducer with metallopeptidase domain